MILGQILNQNLGPGPGPGRGRGPGGQDGQDLVKTKKMRSEILCRMAAGGNSGEAYAASYGRSSFGILEAISMDISWIIHG